MSGTGVFLRTFLRRDRWVLLWWTLAGVLLYWSQAVSVDELYATQAEFDRAAASMEGNAALVAMAGPARALNTVGGQVTWQASAFGAVLVGLMSMFLVGRHTRAEEESGRDELVRSGVVGRYAPMTAALLVGALANLLVGGLVAISLVTYPLAAADSVALGLGLTLCGWVFTGTALVAAQLTTTTRAMYGVAGALIGLAYVLRAVGDVGDPVWRWLSPIGWYQSMHPFSGLRWWPALLLVAGTAVAAGTAYLLFDRRDVGAGLLPPRPGPARGSLRSGIGLAWRLQRGAVLGWTLGLLFVALTYGSIGGDAGEMLGDSAASREMFAAGGGDLVDGFYASAVLMLALIGTGFAVSSAGRPRGEENGGHSEVLLATGLSRRDWLLGHVVVTACGVLLVLGVAGVGLALGYSAATGDSGTALELGAATLAQAAPVLLVSAVARLLYGLAPRLMAAAWLVLVLAVVVMIFGDLLRMPQAVQDLSPFEHLAMVPTEPFRWAPVLVLAALAALVSAAGQLAFLRRDVG